MVQPAEILEAQPISPGDAKDTPPPNYSHTEEQQGSSPPSPELKWAVGSPPDTPTTDRGRGKSSHESLGVVWHAGVEIREATPPPPPYGTGTGRETGYALRNALPQSYRVRWGVGGPLA